jgi:hypothetical protein
MVLLALREHSDMTSLQVDLLSRFEQLDWISVRIF